MVAGFGLFRTENSRMQELLTDTGVPEVLL